MNKYSEFSEQAQEKRRRQRSCTYKVAYDNESDAYQKGQRYYKCDYCGKFHRTGQLGTIISEIRKRRKS
jgi:hypothetical protein